jgi:hypothetical protein
MVHRAPNTLTLIDKKQHGRKRRIIGQGFGDTALRGFEGTIMGHVRKFCDALAKDLPDGKSGKWSSPQNMGKWCMDSPSHSGCQPKLMSFSSELSHL